MRVQAQSATGRVAIALGVAWLCAVASFGPVHAQGAGPGPSEYVSKARNAILLDATSGATMYQLKADELISPASMSKLMTLAVLFKAL